jgi:hypothetical protein
MFAKDTSEKGFLLKMYKEPLNLRIRKQTTQFKNGKNTLK